MTQYLELTPICVATVAGHGGSLRTCCFGTQFLLESYAMLQSRSNLGFKLFRMSATLHLNSVALDGYLKS